MKLSLNRYELIKKRRGVVRSSDLRLKLKKDVAGRFVKVHCVCVCVVIFVVLRR